MSSVYRNNIHKHLTDEGSFPKGLESESDNIGMTDTEGREMWREGKPMRSKKQSRTVKKEKENWGV